MALLDRVTTLIRANLNDLLDKAEDPEKLLRQLLLDMQNQYMQLKTQVAMAIAEQHLLDKKHQENVRAWQDWMQRAELAVEKQEEGLARTALERSLTFEEAAKNFAQQMTDQAEQVFTLRDALHRLEQKMADAKTRAEVLIAQHRRAQLAAKSGANGTQDMRTDAAFDRIKTKVLQAEALGEGHLALNGASAEQQFTAMERSERVEKLLEDLKANGRPSKLIR
jgi:phage shock protein A